VPGRIAELLTTKTPQVIDDKRSFGAGNEARTRDLNLGKVALYQLSYSRPQQRRNCRAVPARVKQNPVRNVAKALNYPVILRDAPLDCDARHQVELRKVPQGRPRLKPGATPQFRPRQTQVLDHRPQRENRRHRRQYQPQLVGGNAEQVLAVQQQ
jgi:hypothetical protein